MQIKFIDTIEVIDNIIEDKNLINDLKGESTIPSTIKGQDIFNLTNPQKKFYEIASKLVINYCFQNNINFDNLKLSNFQKGNLQKYDHSKVSNHLYEPHHDMVESSFITAIYYIDSDYNDKTWTGGELTIYKNLTFAEYPNNAINILSKQNRFIIFPGFLTHRVKPYFGEKPRTSIVLGWSVKDAEEISPIVI
jgi:hypothetical protein